MDFSKLLGPSKISLPIKAMEEYMQTVELEPTQPPPPPPPPQQQQHQHSHPLQRQHQQQQHPQPPPPPPTPPPQPQPLQPQQQQQTLAQFFTPISKEHSFMLLCLHLHDSTISVRKPADIMAALEVFKKELADNLDGAFKKMGFSRKRSLSMDDMKKSVLENHLKPEIISYCCKFLEKNICIIDVGSKPERLDHVFDVLKPWVLIKVKNGEYSLYVGKNTVSDVILAELKQAGHIPEDIKPMQKKRLIKLVGNDKWI